MMFLGRRCLLPKAGSFVLQRGASNCSVSRRTVFFQSSSCPHHLARRPRNRSIPSGGFTTPSHFSEVKTKGSTRMGGPWKDHNMDRGTQFKEWLGRPNTGLLRGFPKARMPAFLSSSKFHPQHIDGLSVVWRLDHSYGAGLFFSISKTQSLEHIFLSSPRLHC